MHRPLAICQTCYGFSPQANELEGVFPNAPQTRRKRKSFPLPSKEASGIPKEGGPIGAMLQEHDEGRAFQRQMRQAFANLADEANRTQVLFFCELNLLLWWESTKLQLLP